MNKRKEIKFCVIGSVDAGKSSLVSVMVHKKLDDGRGLARKKIFRHAHEQESGRTSSISSHYFKVNDDKTLTFIDLAGHEKYLKTTITGITSSFADYAIIVVGSNMGVLRMTKEHLGIALSLNIPIIVVITKIDICPEHILENTKKRLCKILSSKAAGKKQPIWIKDDKDMFDYGKLTMTNKLKKCPIIEISNKLGTRIDLLRNFLSNLSPYDRGIYDDTINLFQIEEKYMITGVGIVVYGVCKKGDIKLNNKMFFGPFNGNFIEASIKSIHNNFKENVEYLSKGDSGCLALKINKKHNIKLDNILRGMVVISNPSCVYEFLAEVVIMHHPTTIRKNYQPVIHCGSVRQTAKICKIINRKLIRTGEKANIRFRFMFKPEYIEENDIIILREGKTKGIGKIKKIFHKVK